VTEANDAEEFLRGVEAVVGCPEKLVTKVLAPGDALVGVSRQAATRPQLRLRPARAE